MYDDENSIAEMVGISSSLIEKSRERYTKKNKIKETFMHTFSFTKGTFLCFIVSCIFGQ